MNARSAQLVAAALAFLLIVLVGAVIFILLSRPGQAPRASATPTTGAVVSFTPLPTLSSFPSFGSPTFSPSVLPTLTPPPSGTPLPTITPEITPTVTPEPTATVAPTDSPTPTISPSPSPTATILPTSPAREIRVRRLGLDSRNPEAGIERYVLFHVDGPSLISAVLSNSSGRVRMCLWQGNLVEARECRTARNGRLDHTVLDAGQTTWTVSLIGFDELTSPTVDFTLDFNASAPLVRFENLRFQGIPIENYNGITVEVDAGAGQTQVEGTFDPGQIHAYRVVAVHLPSGTLAVDETGPATNHFVVAVDDATPTTYSITVSNPNESPEALPIFLEATFSWP